MSNPGPFYDMYVLLMMTSESTAEMFRNCFKFLPGIGPKVYKNDKDLSGQLAIITGANTGVGKETTMEFAKRGAKVIMACRDLEKANKAVEDIRKVVPSADLVVKKLDLSSFESVRQFADEINQEKIQKIDFLVNNAGIMASPKWKTKDGHEMQFGTNHLGHFLLTLLLLEKMKASPSARIINVSSSLHKIGKIHFDDINLDKNYSPYLSYSQSKLANVLFTRELAKRLKDTNVTTFSLHPGVINTELTRHAKESIPCSGLMLGILSIFQISPKLGTQTTMYCALDENIKADSGSYYSNCKKYKLYRRALNEEDAAKLWKISCDIVGVNDG